ncbi:MAG: DUF3617 family protein [Betaproteobacteria bacterium]|nr:DUF3617 family protein [Betaproteobacteria bacterium]
MPRHIAATTILALSLLGAAAAPAFEMPARKPGLWQMSTQSGNNPANVSTLCIDASVGQEMMQMGSAMQKQMCSKHDLTRDGHRVHMHSVCKFGETTAITKGTAVFSGDTAYRMDMLSTYAPPMMGMKEAKTVLEAKWLGACKPGQKPGDMTLPGGMTVNISGTSRAR